MKHIIIILLLTSNAYSQIDTIRGNLIVSDSLFNQKSSLYSFTKTINHVVVSFDQNEVQDINEYVIVDGNRLKLRISHGGCSSRAKAYLVTNGTKYLDKDGNYFYVIKLYFDNPDLCKAMRYKYLDYDITLLKGQKLKYFGRDEYIQTN